jgi:UDP-N-acetyl-D-mannosaminuronic acid dehydrogenase
MRADETIAILGGCGHVGLPLAVTFAARSCDVTIVDVDRSAVERINRGVMSFRDCGAEELLRAHAGKNLRATTDLAALAAADVVICVVGTPIDEHRNPEDGTLLELVAGLQSHLRAGQLFVLRSTVHPGATARVARWFDRHLPGVDVACCPERVAQGHAVEEIATLPQLVSGTTPRAAERARALFARIAPEVIELSPLEAELGKLLCNSWRYVTFAVANQFYALCAASGVDYSRVRDAITRHYPRLDGLPGAGFAAGPCLFKDTLQLTAFYDDDFSLGQAATAINEGFPRVLMAQLRGLGLPGRKVGLLGMAFKADSDDRRDSLAFEMRKLLLLECEEVLCTDEYMRDDWLLPLERVLEEADVLVVTAPHARYRGLSISKPVLDPWNALGRGALLR